MKTNDIRIGNKVKCKISNDSTVYDIVVVDGINAKVMLSGARMNEWIPIEKIKPIPLTDDILIKLGFEKYDTGFEYDSLNYHYWYEKDYPIIGTLVQNSTRQYLFDMNDDKFKIYSLHQLQNLYYTFTGTELNMTL